MSVSIVPCPQCNTLLLSDTIQCPTCKFVFDTDLAAELADVGGMVPQSAGEIPCPDCGEMCRPELVRCFNCGGFLRDEIAQSYLRKQENPTPVTYSQSPPQQRRDSSAGAESISGNADEDRVATGAVSPGGPSQPARRAGLNRQAGWAGPPVAAPAGDDDDFELSPEIAAEQSEDDFELAPGIGVDEIRCEVSRKVEAALPPAEAESDTYGFAAPVTSSPAALKQPGCCLFVASKRCIRP